MSSAYPSGCNVYHDHIGRDSRAVSEKPRDAVVKFDTRIEMYS